MSYIDDLKRGYSYPLPGTSTLPNPTFAPAGGALPVASGNVLVNTANYQASITIPATGTVGQIITVQRTSTGPVTIETTNTDLEEKLSLGTNECARYLYTSTGWKWLEPAVVVPRVTVSSVNPGSYVGMPAHAQNTAATYRSAQAGDVWIQTVDGTRTGAMIATWEYNGYTWQQIGTGTELSVARPAVTVEPTVRSYHGAISVRNDGWTNLNQRTAAATTAMGFEAVGTATILDYNTLWQGRAIAQFNTPVAVVGAAPADGALFDIPANYIRHTVAITPSVDNLYTLSVVADRATSLVVWVCNATTGAPEKRLAAQTISTNSSTRHATAQLTVTEEYGSDHSWFETIGFAIPKALIAAYKTATNTIKLAITPAPGNTGGVEWFINGFGVCEQKIGYTYATTSSLVQRVNGGGSVGAISATLTDGLSFLAIASSAVVNQIRIPLVDTDRDIFLSLIGNSGSSGSSTQHLECVLNSPNGVFMLHRPRPMLRAPLALLTLADVGGGHDVSGYVITSRQLKKFAVTPNNSGVPFLELAIRNFSGTDTAALSGIVTETLA